MTRGQAHLVRTGFFKPVHVKSPPAHALRSLIVARKKLVGQRVTLENQIRGLAVVFGIRLPRALTAAFVKQALKASEGGAGLSAAMRGLIAARTAVMTAVATVDADIRRMTRAFRGLPSADDNPRRRTVDRSRLCRGNRRSLAHPPIPRHRRLSGLGPQAVSVGRGRPHRRHLEMRAATKPRTGGRIQLPQGATPEGGSRRRRRFYCMRPTTGQQRFQPSRPEPSLPHQAPAERAENTGILRRRYPKWHQPLTH
jgi:hypothetical protein